MTQSSEEKAAPDKAPAARGRAPAAGATAPAAGATAPAGEEGAPVAAPTAAGSEPSRMALSAEQLAAVLDLLPEADSVELKLTVPETSHRSTIAALDMDALNAQIRQVFFFDTPDLDLDKAGLVVRARRIQGKGGDTVVKLRPLVPHDLPQKLRKSSMFNVEIDAMPGGFVCSGSLKGRADAAEIRAAALGRRALRKLFSKEQRDLFARHAPEGLGLDDLSVLGPVFVLKLPFVPAGFGRKLVAEMWLYPDGSRILELSTKCLPDELTLVLGKARRYLQDHGVDRSGNQAAKTKRALAFFAAELAAARDAAARG